MWTTRALSWSTALALLSLACSQTPPGYKPSTEGSLVVVYPNYLPVHPGANIVPSDALVPPQLAAPGLDPAQTYLVIMVDPDINYNGTATTALHWYQPDLRVSDSDALLLPSTSTGPSAAYVGPGPPPGEGHRYILLLFEQPEGYELPQCYYHILPLSLEARVGFALDAFVDETGLGKPAAANWLLIKRGQPTQTVPPPTTTFLSSAKCDKTYVSSHVGTQRSGLELR